MLSERLKEDAEMLDKLEIDEPFLIDGAKLSSRDVAEIMRRLSYRIYLEGKVYCRFGDAEDTHDDPLKT